MNQEGSGGTGDKKEGPGVNARTGTTVAALVMMALLLLIDFLATMRYGPETSWQEMNTDSTRLLDCLGFSPKRLAAAGFDGFPPW